MSHNETDGERLMIYCSESARHEGKPLFEWLIERALRLGLAGATAYKGLAGFGRHHRVHHEHILSISDDLPVVVVLVDTPEQVDAFIASSVDALKGYTYTREPVRLHQPNT